MLFTERELCSMTEICNAHLLKSQTLSSGNQGKTTEINSGKATQDQEKTYCRCERICHRSFRVAVKKRVVITVFFLAISPCRAWNFLRRIRDQRTLQQMSWLNIQRYLCEHSANSHVSILLQHWNEVLLRQPELKGNKVWLVKIDGSVPNHTNYLPNILPNRWWPNPSQTSSCLAQLDFGWF